MEKWHKEVENAEMIQGLSDKELNKYITDPSVIRSSWRPFAIEESNRRRLNKIAKIPLLTKIAFVFIVLTFILTVYAIFFK